MPGTGLRLQAGKCPAAFVRSPQKLAAYDDRIGVVEDDVRAGYVGKGMGTRITRASMAAFILDPVESNAYIQ